MSQAHSPIPANPPQDYSGYQYRTVLPQPSSPSYNQSNPSPIQPSTHYYDPQHQPNPAYNPSHPQYYTHSPQQQQPLNTPIAQSPFAPSPASSFAPRSPMSVAVSQQAQFQPTNGYHAVAHGIQAPASVPPMQQNSTFSQSPFHPSRRPLPTPSGFQQGPSPAGVARPFTQPPLSRRPLPQPQASPSAPNSPFRHRPSSSVADHNSASGFSTRPLPTPISRSSKSLDLTHSGLPAPSFQPSPLHPNAHHNLPDLPEKPDGLPLTSSQIHRTPTSARPLPLPQRAHASPSVSPSASPPKIARTISTEEGSRIGTASPFRNRSRTLPHALPPPTGALPHRPDSVLPPPRFPPNANYAAAPQRSGSSVSSESEDMYDNPLLRRPQQQQQQQYASPARTPERTPSPLPPTQSRFIERSPERGRQVQQSTGNPNQPPTRTRRLSLVSRMAEMSLIEAAASSAGARKELPNTPPNGNNSSPPKPHPMAPLSRGTVSQQSQPRWPSDLPPLPRAPQSEPGEQRMGSRQVSPARSQPPQHPMIQQAPPAASARSQFLQYQRGRSEGGSQQFPPPPTHPESPTKREFFPSSSSRDPSPNRSVYSGQSHQSQIQGNGPPALPPRNNTNTSSSNASNNSNYTTTYGNSSAVSLSNPSSPTRPRFTRQAPVREPILPAPRAQRMIPNLEDAPPPSLRRSPSPAPAPQPAPSTRSSGMTNMASNSNRRSYQQHQAAPSLPNIRTENMGSGMGSPTKMAVVSPPGMTPKSADSAFSLSAFPAPPTRQVNSNFAFPMASGPGASGPGGSNMRMHSRNVSFPASPDEEDDGGYTSGPSISVSGPPTPHTHPHNSPNSGGVPQISIQGMDDDNDQHMQMPVISVGGPEEATDPTQLRKIRQRDLGPLPRERSKGGMCCGGCGNAVIGRAVHTTDASWHPGCLKCTACGELLVDLAVCEYEGRPYCSLDYYENFAPRCHHCQTAIADPNYVTLKDEQLGERTYHEQHFFCAECGDPFLPPSSQPRNRSFEGDGPFEADEGIKFIVHNFHAYCERCHVRLRMPKCKNCKKSLRTDDDQLEFLGQKYCPECFVCKGCEGPFVNGQLFVRDNKPFCRRCYDIIIKSEL